MQNQLEINDPDSTNLRLTRGAILRLSEFFYWQAARGRFNKKDCAKLRFKFHEARFDAVSLALFFPPPSFGSFASTMEPETSIMPQKRGTSTAASLISGSMGGMAQVLVGQPLDTIKTRAQTAAKGQFKGPLDIATQTIKKEGFFALYKGEPTKVVF